MMITCMKKLKIRKCKAINLCDLYNFKKNIYDEGVFVSSSSVKIRSWPSFQSFPLSFLFVMNLPYPVVYLLYNEPVDPTQRILNCCCIRPSHLRHFGLFFPLRPSIVFDIKILFDLTISLWGKKNIKQYKKKGITKRIKFIVHMLYRYRVSRKRKKIP